MADPIGDLSKLLGLSPRVTAWATGAIALMTISNFIAAFIKDLSAVPAWEIFAGLVIVIGAGWLLQRLLSILVRLNVNRTLIGLAVWVPVAAFSLWSVAFAVQLKFDNTVRQLPSSTCLVNPFDATCGSVRSVPQNTDSPKTLATPPVVSATEVSKQEKSSAKIFLQFSIYPRDVPIAIAASLLEQGWNVEGGGGGGERTGDADGLHEVRYFHADDAGLAGQLALDLKAATPGNPEILVRDLSKTALAKKVPAKQMEIWISKLAP